MNLNRRKMNKSRVLLCIDVQNDFVSKEGKLSVKNADTDLKKLCNFIENTHLNIKSCIFTLDSHKSAHISNAINWVDKNNYPIEPYTQITNAEVANGSVKHVGPIHIPVDYIVDYISKLYENQVNFVVWPEHCIVGTKGHEIPSELTSLVNKKHMFTSYVIKGLSNHTEFYSAIEPDVVIDGDEHAQINTSLLQSLSKFDEIYVSGQAYDYCVMSTLISIAKHLPEKVKDVYILTDTTSCVNVSKQAVEENLKMYGFQNFITTDSLIKK